MSRICLYVFDKGYWTGFVFKKKFNHKDVKTYKTRVGARRAATWLSKRHQKRFYVTYIHRGAKNE